MSFAVEVLCAVSLDGAISTPDRRPWRWSDAADHEWLLSRMAAADLLVTGSGTIRSEDPSLVVPAEWAERRLAAGKPAQPTRLVLTPGLSIPTGCRALRAPDARLLIAAHPRSIAERGTEYSGRATLLPWTGRDGLRTLLQEALRHAAGGHVVSLGGGRTNAGLLQADLVDRISLTVCSFVVGAKGAPGPFDGSGFAPGNFPQFRVIEERTAGRDRILVYERDRTAPPRHPHGGLD